MKKKLFRLLLILATILNTQPNEQQPAVDESSSVAIAPVKPEAVTTEEPQIIANPAEPTRQEEAIVLRPELKIIKKEKKALYAPTGVEINFENVALTSFIQYISDLFDATFLLEESSGPTTPMQGGFNQPQQPQAKKLADIKINFKGHHPLLEKEIWALLDLFLDNAGYARIAQKNVGKGIFRIVAIPVSNKSPLPIYIGTRIEELPETGRIRYIYFVKNTSIDQIKALLDKIKSQNALLETVPDMRAVIVTDNAVNIKTMFEIIKEIDTGEKPEILSILKLQNTEAGDVKTLYDNLRQKDNPFGRGTDKKFGNSYFPSDAKLIAEPRTNSLILLGTKDSIRRIEDFVVNNIDTKLKKLPSPIHVYQLNYAPADKVKDILNAVTLYGQSTLPTATEYGGVRGGEKFFSKMYVEAEMQGNRLLIRSSEEDFQLLKPTIAALDKMQPQVVVEVLIVNLTLNKTKAINSAFRNKNKGEVNFQTSGFFGTGIQVNGNGVNNDFSGGLVTNLINLATAAVSGTTVFSLGKESVWALIGVLDQTTNVNIISNPFLTTTNKYNAHVKLGETRRIATGTVVGGSTTNTQEFDNEEANIEVDITPQISDYGVINLDITVTVEDFTSTDFSNGNKSSKIIKTNANVANGEILALGGLIQNRENNSESGLPILRRIPIIKYLFSNKNKTKTNDNLIIFMTPKIIVPMQNSVGVYTQKKAQFVRDALCEIEMQESPRDPIYQWWFKDRYDRPIDVVNDAITPPGELITPNSKPKYSLTNIKGEQKVNP